MRPLSLRPFFTPVLLAAALCACSSNPSESSGVHTTTCTDTFEAVYVPGTDATGTTWPNPGAMRTAGDTLIVGLGDSSLRVFPPNGTPTTLQLVDPPGGPADLGTLEDFWASGSSIVLVMSGGVFEMPLAGGGLTPITTSTQVGGALAHDATTLYSAVGSSTATGSYAYFVSSQSLAGGASVPLATVPVSQNATFDAQLFDMGDVLWLEDSNGDVFSIAKSGGAVSTVGNVAGAGLLFAPNGTKAFYGASEVEALGSYALTSGGAAWQWPDDAPTFRAFSYAIGSDGTAYFGGIAYVDTQLDSSSALVVVPPGKPATSIARCGSPGQNAVALAVGDTFLYAAVQLGGFMEIVRMPK